ncbi:MAG: winged helix-turn-helix transcriptional regulator [Rhodobacteraceae bacterium]|nr:winged helix-turn-helix transcriptional regulator [Paracoccaceae bacterium]
MVEISAISQICLVHHLRRAARAASQKLDRALAPLGLQASQFTVLCALAAADTVTAGDLARQLAMERSTLNRNLGPLTQAGWVSATGGRGRRGLTLTLTPQGRELLGDATDSWRAVQREIADKIGPSEAGRLLSVLELACTA